MAVSSVLLKNINTLKAALKDSIDYVDLRYNGIDDTGSVTINDEKCIMDKYKIWLQSGTNDFHRNPAYGGFLEKEVVKTPLSSANAEAIKSKLYARTAELFPNIELVECEVNANMTKRRWEIKVAVMDLTTGLVDTSMFNTNGSTIIQAAN